MTNEQYIAAKTLGRKYRWDTNSFIGRTRDSADRDMSNPPTHRVSASGRKL